MEQILTTINQAITGTASSAKLSGKEKDIIDIKKRLDQITKADIKVLICGEFKKGKSSFVNAFIGRNICPVDQDICTSVVTIIKYGEKERVVRYFGSFDSLQNQEIEFSELKKYTVGNASDIDNTIFIEIDMPLERLKSGLVIIDTPGVGGLDPRNAFLTTYFLPQADITLFITDVNEPLTTTELDFYKQKIVRYSKHNAVIVNKCDQKPADKVEDIVQDTKTKITKHCEISENQFKVLKVSSLHKLSFNKTRQEPLLKKSQFADVEDEIDKLVSLHKTELLKALKDELTDLIKNLLDPLKIKLSQLKSPDPKRIVELKNQESVLQQQLNDLNNPNSEFRLNIQKQITGVREDVINYLNEQSIIFTSQGLNELLNSPEAKAEDGAEWVKKRLNEALDSLGAEVVLELRKAFDQISQMAEFNGMLNYKLADISLRVAGDPIKKSIPVHKRLMSFLPGMGAGYATNLVLGGIASFLGGPIIAATAIAVGIGVAVQSAIDTQANVDIANITSTYAPQLNVAISQLRTFVESRFSEFQTEWITVVSNRTNENRNQLIKLTSDLKILTQDQNRVLSQKLELGRLINPLETHLAHLNLLYSNPFEVNSNHDKIKEVKPDPNETMC